MRVSASRILARFSIGFALTAAACGPPVTIPWEDSGVSDTAVDSDDTGGSIDTDTTQETDDTGETGDTGDTAETDDSGTTIETDTDTDPVDDSDTDTDTTLGFADDISPLLSACTPCHVNSTSGTLNFANGASDLVNVTATNANPNVVYVKPGDYLNSLLWRKIAGSQSVLGNGGERMPKNGPPYLPQASQDAVRDWINQGANP